MKEGCCPACRKVLSVNQNGVCLVRYSDDSEALWCSTCRDEMAPEETSLFIRSAFGATPQVRLEARQALERMEERIRAQLEARHGGPP